MSIQNVNLSTKLEKDPSRGGESIKLKDTEKFTKQVLCGILLSEFGLSFLIFVFLSLVSLFSQCYRV